VLDLAGVLLARSLSPEQFAAEYADLSVSIRSWVEGLLHDVTGIMLWFSIGVLVLGVALLVVSFFIKPREVTE